MPRSHKITFSLPSAIIYSADISNSSMVALNPRFSKIGLFVCPTAFKRSKFCILRAPIWMISTSSTNLSSLLTDIISDTIGNPVAALAIFNNSSPSSFKP